MCLGYANLVVRLILAANGRANYGTCFLSKLSIVLLLASLICEERFMVMHICINAQVISLDGS